MTVIKADGNDTAAVVQKAIMKENARKIAGYVNLVEVSDYGRQYFDTFKTAGHPKFVDLLKDEGKCLNPMDTAGKATRYCNLLYVSQDSRICQCLMETAVRAMIL